MWLINLAMMNFNFDFLRNDTNGVFDKVLYHKVSCLFISSEPCLFIIKLWNNVPLPCNSQEVMKWMMFWPEVNFKGKNDPLSWIAFKQIAKKKEKKKRPEKIWASSGAWCFKVSKWATDNWDWHTTEPCQILNLSAENSLLKLV